MNNQGGIAPRTPSAILGSQVKYWRNRRRISAQVLANRAAELGAPALTRAAISKIESGSRGVGLDEWLQLAHALAVPPPLLFLDLATEEPVAVTPDVVLHPRVMWHWLDGEHAPPSTREGGQSSPSRVTEWADAATEVRIYTTDERNAVDACQPPAERELIAAAIDRHTSAVQELTKATYGESK